MPKGQTVFERFEQFVERVPESGCWLWVGRVDPDRGYGQFYLDGRIVRAHRAAWNIYRGPITNGLHALHRCDVRCCVNPAHLFLGTPSDNMRDCLEKGRHRVAVYERNQTHCKRGHPLSGPNLYTPPGSKRRFCRACHRITHPHLYPKWWREAKCQQNQESPLTK